MRNDWRATAALVLFISSFTPSISRGREPLILGDPPTETPAHKASLISLPDGSVEVYYLREGRNGKEIVSRRTQDEGRHWSESKVVYELPGGHVASMTEGDWIILKTVATTDGELEFFILRCGKMGARAGLDQFISAWFVRSHDGRIRWDAPRILYDGLVGPPRCGIELLSGRIVYPFDRELGDRDSNYPTGMGEIMCAYSDDHRDSWLFSPSKLTAPVDPVYRAPNYGALEPVIVPLKDERLWMLMRTSVGRLYESYSSDNGEHWTSAAPTRFYSSNSPAAVVRLHDGRLVLFWNNSQNAPSIDGSEPYTNRDVLHGAISMDDGKTWSGFREIYRAPRRNQSPPKEGTSPGTSYPHAVETTGKKILVMAGHGPDSAKLLLVDPDWLLETRASEHFEKGLERWCVYKCIGPIESSWRARIAGALLENNPDKQSAKVLHVRRPHGEPADGAVWNFPKGQQGTLKLRMRLNPSFAGASIALADRYYDPTDVAGERQALFDLRISNFRQLMSGAALDVARWYSLELKWNVEHQRCAVAVDGKHVLDLPELNASSDGPNYLRLRSLAQTTDDGFLIEAVDVDTENTQAGTDSSQERSVTHR